MVFRMDHRLRSFGFLLKDVSRRHLLRFEQHAIEISLTLVQCRALVHLETNEGVSQARLAELTEVEPMTMVRILDHMEAEGVLERRPDPDDRRVRRLYLTRKAKPLLEEIGRLVALTRAEAFAGIGRAELEVFIDVLERININLGALAGGSPASCAEAPAKPSSGKRLVRRITPR
jgi:DNA-binding MarR family transcriptional regulator